MGGFETGQHSLAGGPLITTGPPPWCHPGSRESQDLQGWRCPGPLQLQGRSRGAVQPPLQQQERFSPITENSSKICRLDLPGKEHTTLNVSV